MSNLPFLPDEIVDEWQCPACLSRDFDILTFNSEVINIIVEDNKYVDHDTEHSDFYVQHIHCVKCGGFFDGELVEAEVTK